MTPQSDEGVYSVEAMNNNGSSTLHFYLSFSGRSSAPVVYNVAAPDTLLQGETVRTPLLGFMIMKIKR